jgi:hypothetical protein
MGNDLPEKYGGYCEGSLVISGESFDPSVKVSPDVLNGGHVSKVHLPV